MGRTSGKRVRLIVISAITDGGALAEAGKDGFPITEGLFTKTARKKIDTSSDARGRG